MNEPPSKKDSNADFGAVARNPGGGNKVEAAQVAADRQIRDQTKSIINFSEDESMTAVRFDCPHSGVEV